MASYFFQMGLAGDHERLYLGIPCVLFFSHWNKKSRNSVKRMRP